MKYFESFPIFVIDLVNHKYNQVEVPAEMITADAATWAAYMEAAQEMLDGITDAIQHILDEHSGYSSTLDELDELIRRNEAD